MLQDGMAGQTVAACGVLTTWFEAGSGATLAGAKLGGGRFNFFALTLGTSGSGRFWPGCGSPFNTRMRSWAVSQDFTALARAKALSRALFGSSKESDSRIEVIVDIQNFSTNTAFLHLVRRLSAPLTSTPLPGSATTVSFDGGSIWYTWTAAAVMPSQPAWVPPVRQALNC